MASYRTDIRPVQIILSDFDQGKTHKIILPKSDNVQIGDVIDWESGSNHHGCATVVSVEDCEVFPQDQWIELRERR